MRLRAARRAQRGMGCDRGVDPLGITMNAAGTGHVQVIDLSPRAARASGLTESRIRLM